MDPNFYKFRSEWSLAAPFEDVYYALSQLGDYPSWWPEVRSTRQLSEEAYELVCRSLLPYDLVFSSTQARRDPVAGILEAAMKGDLSGFSRWTITRQPAPNGRPAPDVFTGGTDATGTLAVFEEEVTAEKALLRRFGRIARPAFEANHSLMMRHGRQGLRTFLAGMRLAHRRAEADG